MGMNVGAKSGKGVTPSMNVTPLVDVVLVLLIIFMVVTPLLTKNFWLNLPKKDTEQQDPKPMVDPDQPVVLTVDAQGVIKINKQVVDKRELKEKLERIFAARKDQILFFDAANDAPFGVATEAMDLARSGGAATISILTERVE